MLRRARRLGLGHPVLLVRAAFSRSYVLRDSFSTLTADAPRVLAYERRPDYAIRVLIPRDTSAGKLLKCLAG